jgi:hypothetical protein
MRTIQDRILEASPLDPTKPSRRLRSIAVDAHLPRRSRMLIHFPRSCPDIGHGCARHRLNDLSYSKLHILESAVADRHLGRVLHKVLLERARKE